MDADRLIEYIQNPGALNASSLLTIEQWLKNYPYFQTAHLLRIKNLQNLQGQADPKELHRTAAYVCDRKVLYYLLQTPVAEPDTEMPEVEKATGNIQPEKEYKESLQENISDAVTQQFKRYTGTPDRSREFTPGLAIDVRKTYGRAPEHESAAPRVAKKSFDDDALLEWDHDDVTMAPPTLSSVSAEERIADGEGQNERFRENEVTDRPIAEPVKPAQDPSGGKADLIREIRAEIPYDLNALYGDTETTDNASLIDRFIQANPKITGNSDAAKEQEDISADSVKEHESFFTDTLAQIYLKQGNYTKAILAYEKLSLKYPEKSAYFAGQISEIKKLIHKS